MTFQKIRLKKNLSFRFLAAYGIFAAFVFLSSTAEVWSNSAPLVLKMNGTYHVPAFREVPARELGIKDRIRVDYKQLKFAEGDWAVWPINRWSPNEINRDGNAFPMKPSSANWLGTDDRGRDVFARLLYGARLTLIFATAVWLLSTAVALLVGAVAGYLGGWVDLVSQRFIEILSTVPQLFILIFLVTIFEPSMSVLIAVNVVFGWISTSYYVRAEALRIRELEYIQAAIGFGASKLRIILQHVIPNALGPALTLSPFIIIGNVTALTALDFMGLGLPAPAPSWGELLAQGQSYFATAWWLAVFPTLTLFLLLISIALIGEHARNLLENPRRAKEGSSFGECIVKTIRWLGSKLIFRRTLTVRP